MKVRIRIVMFATQGAIKVTLAKHPYRIHWLPKFAIRGKANPGDENIEIWLRPDIAAQKEIEP